MYNVYSFGSSTASDSSSLPRSLGVENYITHNGDFEFFKVNGKCYDLEVVQQWLEKVLHTPMPATVDSGECIAYILELIAKSGRISHLVHVHLNIFQLPLLELSICLERKDHLP